MPFAIEALQSKSKLNNIKSRQFEQTLWPELRQKEDNTIVQAVTHNIKNVVRTLLARVRRVQADRDDGGIATQVSEQHEGFETIAIDENDENDEKDGFLEINIIKRIRTGNKLILTATTVDRE